MYYKTQVEGVARIQPNLFAEELSEAVIKQLKSDYEGQIIPELGMVIAVLSVEEIGEGVIIPGDGAAYYRCTFTAVHYDPEINELVEGEIKDIAKFGAFIDFGPFEGMVHVSQTMDDFVSFAKDKVLTGKDTKRTLKVGDKCKARIIAVSFKDLTNPKLGLTMRQLGLGRLEWIEEESRKKTEEPKEEKETKKAKKK